MRDNFKNAIEIIDTEPRQKLISYARKLLAQQEIKKAFLQSGIPGKLAYAGWWLTHYFSKKN